MKTIQIVLISCLAWLVSSCGQVTNEIQYEEPVIEADIQPNAQVIVNDSSAIYDLDWWIDELMPVLKEFTKTAEGDVNTDFWESIFKMKQRGCNGILVTGWIVKFFPYTQSNKHLEKFIGNDRMMRKWDETDQKVMVAHIDMFPSGISKSPFIWDYYGVKYKMEFNAGFVGYTQDPKTLSLRPEIGWTVLDLGEKSWAKKN